MAGPIAMRPLELRAWRAERWLSQVDLADLLGITRQTIYVWEAGRTGIPPYVRYALMHLDTVETWGPPRRGRTDGDRPTFDQRIREKLIPASSRVTP